MCFLAADDITAGAREKKPATEENQKPHADFHGDPLPAGALARLGTLRFRSYRRDITSLRFSPDGRVLISIKENEGGDTWHAATDEQEAHFSLPKDSAAWTLTADGRWLAAVAKNLSSVRVSETAADKTIRKLVIRGHTFDQLCLSADGKLLVAVVTDGMANNRFLRVWILPDGKEVRDIPFPPREGDEGLSTENLSLVANGKILAATIANRESVTFRRWDIAAGRELPTSSNHSNRDGRPTLSPDGKLLAIGVEDAEKRITVHLVDAASGKSRRELGPALRGQLLGIRFSPDGRSVLAIFEGQQKGVIRLWDAASGKPFPSLALDEVLIRDTIFAPDGRTIAIHAIGAIQLYQVATGKRLHKLNTSNPYDEMEQIRGFVSSGELSAHSRLAFSPDGKLLADATDEARIRKWDVASGKEIRAVPGGHERSVSAVAFAPNGKTVVSISSDGTVRLWEAASGRELRVLTLAKTKEVPLIQDLSAFDVTFSPDGQTVAAVNPFNLVQRWAVDTGASRLQFLVRKGGVQSLLFSPSGKRLLTGGQGRVLSWDAKAGKPIHSARTFALAEGRRIENDEDGALKLAVSPDGRLLAAVRRRIAKRRDLQLDVHDLQIRELATGKLRRRIPDDASEQQMLDRQERFDNSLLRGVSGRLSLAFAPNGCKEPPASQIA
jgi:WD40 repeat protein